MDALLTDLNERKERLGLDVDILGANPDATIPGLKGPRAKCEAKFYKLMPFLYRSKMETVVKP